MLRWRLRSRSRLFLDFPLALGYLLRLTWLLLPVQSALLRIGCGLAALVGGRLLLPRI